MKKKIQNIIIQSIEAFNKSNEEGFSINQGLKTHLTGPKSNLDSVALISFLLEVEKHLKKKLKKKIIIVDEKVFQNIQVLKNIESLTTHIQKKINGK